MLLFPESEGTFFSLEIKVQDLETFDSDNNIITFKKPVHDPFNMWPFLVFNVLSVVFFNLA